MNLLEKRDSYPLYSEGWLKYNRLYIDQELENMKTIKFKINGEIKDMMAHNLAHFWSKFRRLYPDYKQLTMSDLQPQIIE